MEGGAAATSGEGGAAATSGEGGAAATSGEGGAAATSMEGVLLPHEVMRLSPGRFLVAHDPVGFALQTTKEAHLVWDVVPLGVTVVPEVYDSNLPALLLRDDLEDHEPVHDGYGDVWILVSDLAKLEDVCRVWDDTMVLQAGRMIKMVLRPNLSLHDSNELKSIMDATMHSANKSVTNKSMNSPRDKGKELIPVTGHHGFFCRMPFRVMNVELLISKVEKWSYYDDMLRKLDLLLSSDVLQQASPARPPADLELLSKLLTTEKQLLVLAMFDRNMFSTSDVSTQQIYLGPHEIIKYLLPELHKKIYVGYDPCNPATDTPGGSDKTQCNLQAAVAVIRKANPDFNPNTTVESLGIKYVDLIGKLVETKFNTSVDSDVGGVRDVISKLSRKISLFTLENTLAGNSPILPMWTLATDSNHIVEAGATAMEGGE